MSEALLAIDLGTSSTKLLIVDRTGSVVARRRLPHPTHRPVRHAAEQDPAVWWQNLVRGIAGISAHLPSSTSIVAIGVTGQMHGLVAHDDSGEPVRPAITWEDQRSAATLPALRRRLPSGHPTILPGYQTAIWHWLMQTEPATAGRVSHLLLPKDEIVWRLTGARVTDPSDAIGTGCWALATACWEPLVLAATATDRSMLPRIVPSGSIAGSLTGTAATSLGLAPGIPVVIAGGDAAVAAFGAGATDITTPLVMLSTGCQAMTPATSLPVGDGWPSANPPGLPRWLRVATTMLGGNVISQARATYGAPSPAVHPDRDVFVWLHRERADTGPRPHPASDGPTLTRAVMDGVSLMLADAFAQAGGAIGIATPVLAGGGGTQDHAWLQSLTDALARPVGAVAEPDLSAWGAARATATALGWIDPAATPSAWRPPVAAIQPTTSPTRALDRLQHYRAMPNHRAAPDSC